MPNVKPLTNIEVQNINRPGLHADGNGLYLRVLKDYDPSIDRKAKKSWIFRYSMNKKAHMMGLGPLRDVSLAEARELAGECRKLVRKGLDPIADRQEEKAHFTAKQARAMTFEECAKQYIQAQREGWKNAKHASQWENTLASYVFPKIGSLPVNEVNAPLIKSILDPIWHEKTETASRVRSRIENILDWATSLDLRHGDNPAAWSRMKHHFPSKNKVQKTKSHPALPFEAIDEFMPQLRVKDTVSARALEFLILTAARTGEVINATFDEFDQASGIWSIPGERMKAKRDHRVPLSPAALKIINATASTATCQFVFPGRNGKSPISNMAMLKMLKEEFDPRLTVHGFRSTFTDWARERTDYQRDVVEMALAHTIKDKTEAAYRRGDLLDKRRLLMEDWAKYCDTAPRAGNVTSTLSHKNG